MRFIHMYFIYLYAFHNWGFSVDLSVDLSRVEVLFGHICLYRYELSPSFLSSLDFDHNPMLYNR